MMNQKRVFLVILGLIFASLQVSALVEVTKSPVSKTVISELNQPAVYNINIRNLGEADKFEIYSLISGIDMTPTSQFIIAKDESLDIESKISLKDHLKQNPGALNFMYKIRGNLAGVQEDIMEIEVVKLKEVIQISALPINPDSEVMIVHVKNKFDTPIPEAKLKFDSAFFKTTEATISLGANEEKEIKIPVSKEKSKSLIAGKFILSCEFSAEGAKENFEGAITFSEKSGISTRETSSGFFLRVNEIEKRNDGNLPVIATAEFKRDIISRLFTQFSSKPDKAERNGLYVKYSWMDELKPSESFTITVETNYLYPFLILLVIIIGLAGIYYFTASSLVLKKRVSFVKAKGGEFALKVTVTASAKKYIEKISVIDKLPMMVRIYEKFGAHPPTRIDQRNGRLEWDIEALQPGEERVFTYIIYSKIGVVGKFELPETTAVYEKEGKIHETKSNKTYFANEPMKNSEE